jgi:prepilin-type N-terminal cleavage/methylation domain-containing protein
MRRQPSERGFSLIEVLIAIVISATAFTAAARLLMLASGATRRARLVTRAAILATSKMEELESLAYRVGDDGADLQDKGQSESPDRSLTENVPDYCEWFDSAGRPVGAGQRPAGGLFVRRWSIRALDDSGDLLALQVLVATDAGPPVATLTAIRARRVG